MTAVFCTNAADRKAETWEGLVAKCSETRLAGLTVCCLGGEATP